MSKRISEQLRASFKEEERRDCLLVPRSESMRRAVRHLCETGIAVMPFKGMYALRDSWKKMGWRNQAGRIIRTYAQLHPECLFCSFTAAFVLGLWVPKARVLEGIHLVGDANRKSPWTVTHFVQHPEIYEVDSLHVTAPERTVLDCLRALGFRNGLAVGDSFLRLTGLPVDEATGIICAKFAGYRGISRVREVMPHADVRSESGGESYARAVMLESGVMPPALQVEVPQAGNPLRTYRLDFGWLLPDGTRVGGELDGYEKTANPDMLRGRTMNEAYRAERLRESQITSLGIQVARFTFGMCVQTTPLLQVLDMFRIPRARTAARW